MKILVMGNLCTQLVYVLNVFKQMYLQLVNRFVAVVLFASETITLIDQHSLRSFILRNNIAGEQWR